jgi:hypothetical protein
MTGWKRATAIADERRGIRGVAIGMLPVTALVLALFMGSAARAQSTDDQTIGAYVLTMTKVVDYDAAVQALQTALSRDPAVKNEYHKYALEFSDNLRAIRARFDRHPKILAFYTNEKLTEDDAVLLPVALRNGCLAADGSPFADRMPHSDAQMQFCKANSVALHKLRIFTPVRPSQ